jgi:DNA primase
MEAVTVPGEVRRLVIFADRDAAGERAAERAAAAHEHGRELAVVFPPEPHKDWNDLLQGDSTWR